MITRPPATSCSTRSTPGSSRSRRAAATWTAAIHDLPAIPDRRRSRRPPRRRRNGPATSYQGESSAGDGVLPRFAPNIGGVGGPPDLDGVDCRPVAADPSRSTRAAATPPTACWPRAFDDGVAITAAADRRRQPTRSHSWSLVEILGVARHPGRARPGQLVGDPARHPAGQADDRRRRPSIAGGDLSVRVPEGAPGTEPGELAMALNQMLGQHRGRARRPGAHPRIGCAGSSPTPRTSCARRSPRSGATPSCTGTAASPTDDALADAMRRTEQEAVRMGRLVDDMLHAGQARPGPPARRAAGRPRGARADAAADARAAAPDRSITVDVPDEPAP